MKHLFQEYAVLLIKKKNQDTDMLLHEGLQWTPVFDQLKEDASSFAGFAYPNESKHRFIIYIYRHLFIYLFIYLFMLFLFILH